MILSPQRKRQSSIGDKMEVSVETRAPSPPPVVPTMVKNLRRSLSLMQMVLLNAIVCGLEFCASAAFCYIPPMLLKAGMSEENMSFVLGIGPLLGFFFVPIIGRASDRCRSKYGRRRPFIFGLSLMLIISLMLIPYGEQIGYYADWGFGISGPNFSLTLLVVGAVLLDFASQACLTPCEALLSDASRNTPQQDQCFMVYSFMVSLGGCIGYLITALDWSTSTVGMYFGSQEKSAFSMLVILFTFSMLTTLGVADEAPANLGLTAAVAEPVIHPSQIDRNVDEIHKAIVRQEVLEIANDSDDQDVPNNDIPSGLHVPPNDPGYESGSNQSVSEESPLVQTRAPSGDSKSLAQRLFPWLPWGEQSCSVPWTRWSFTTSESLFRLVSLKLYHIFPDTLKALVRIPYSLSRLALANFCSWTAVMGFNLFYTDFVGQAIYGGDPNADETSPLRDKYDLGVRMGSWGLLFHCMVSALYASFIERLVARYGTRLTYFWGMFSFTIAMATMVFSRNIYIVNLMAACTGFAFATVTTIPFMLVTLYHEHKEVR